MWPCTKTIKGMHIDMFDNKTTYFCVVEKTLFGSSLIFLCVLNWKPHHHRHPHQPWQLIEHHIYHSNHSCSLLYKHNLIVHIFAFVLSLSIGRISTLWFVFMDALFYALCAFSLDFAINQCHPFLLAAPVNPISNSITRKMLFVHLLCH